MKTNNLEADYKYYSRIIEDFNRTYSKRSNLYNTFFCCVKSIKKEDSDELREALKRLFNDFKEHIDNLIYVLEYLKLKKCKSFNVYCELLTYLRSFKDGRIDSNLHFITTN